MHVSFVIIQKSLAWIDVFVATNRYALNAGVDVTAVANMEFVLNVSNPQQNSKMMEQTMMHQIPIFVSKLKIIYTAEDVCMT